MVSSRFCFVVPTKDPGVYGTARELLRPFERLHRRAVVMLDSAWDGSPGREQIHDDIAASLKTPGSSSPSS